MGRGIDWLVVLRLMRMVGGFTMKRFIMRDELCGRAFLLAFYVCGDRLEAEAFLLRGRVLQGVKRVSSCFCHIATLC